jgi:glycosyltransferase involved in cell wall biosynthesis
MKKVAIIGTVGIPAKYGGFETLANHLTKQLNTEFKFTVYCSKNAYNSEERVSQFQGARLVYLPLNANGFQSVIYDIVSVFHALFYADTLLILGISGGLILPFVKWFTGKKVIVNIDGLEWRRNKWNFLAKWFLKLSERIAVHFSHAVITDNQAIKDYTWNEYQSITHLIEYGGDHAVRQPESSVYLTKYSFMHAPYAFKVARIEPENNVHVILQAFSRTTQILVIVGNWNNSTYGKELKKRFEIRDNLHLLDPIYNQLELDAIRQGCQVYLHGHSAGGTNPSLVEAMTLALPILSFDVSYNRETTENRALYFRNEEDLLRQIFRLKYSELQKNGQQMLQIAERRYTWSVIAEKYKNLVCAVGNQTQNTRSFRPKRNKSDMEITSGKLV